MSEPDPVEELADRLEEHVSTVESLDAHEVARGVAGEVLRARGARLRRAGLAGLDLLRDLDPLRRR